MWFSYIAAGNPDPLHEIFKNNRVDLVMTGHYHYYFSGEYDGVKYISLGSSGGSTQTDPMDVLYQYAYITVDMAGVHPVVLKKGSVLDWDYMTAADYNIIYSFPREGFAFDPQLYFEPSLTLMPASFNLSVKNLGPDALADTLRWIADEGWKIEPKEVPLTLEPGDSCLINFSASSELQTAQLPYFELKIPFRPGYSAPIDYPLDVSRRTRAAAMSSAPLIDGNLGEWQGTAETLFFYGRANPLPDGATKIVFAHDDANLFVSGSADFPPDYKLKADAAGRDSAVYNDDCFGFFFCPDPSSNTVYQIYINPMGVIFDQKLKFKNGTFDMDRAWDGNVEVKTTVGTDGWTMEARIPYLELGLTGEAAEEWLVNFRRKMPGFNEAADWRQPISYDPASFGVLRLE